MVLLLVWQTSFLVTSPFLFLLHGLHGTSALPWTALPFLLPYTGLSTHCHPQAPYLPPAFLFPSHFCSFPCLPEQHRRHTYTTMPCPPGPTLHSATTTHSHLPLTPSCCLHLMLGTSPSAFLSLHENRRTSAPVPTFFSASYLRLDTGLSPTCSVSSHTALFLPPTIIPTPPLPPDNCCLLCLHLLYMLSTYLSTWTMCVRFIGWILYRRYT